MPSLSITPASLARFATAAAVISTLIYASTSDRGPSLNITKQRPVVNVNSYIQTWSNSGSQIAGVSTNGILTASGGFAGLNIISCSGGLTSTSSGMIICASAGSAGVSQTNADARYVNTSGDTMTGGLLIRSAAAGAPAVTIDAGVLLEVLGTASGRIIKAQDQLRSSGSLVVDGTALLRGTTSGSTFLRGGKQIHSQKCASAILFGSGSDVTVGQARAFFTTSFSGSLVKVHAKHGWAGNGLTTYDVNINGVTRLSTKLTVDANEKCSDAFGPAGTGTCTDAAAAPPVITTPNFAAGQEVTIDVDAQAGGTAPKASTVTICVEPDIDGYTTY